MKVVYKFFALLTIALFLGSCNSPDLKRDMVDFDKAFIPAYYYAYTGAVDDAGRAMIPLKRRWEHLEKTYLGVHPASEDWQESFRLTRAWLEEAEMALKSSDAEQATYDLDHARYEMMDLRWRANMPYYLDAYWDLEGAISVLVESAEDQMMGLLEWNDFMCQTKDVRMAWNKIKEGPAVPDWFGLPDASEIELLRRQLEFEGKLVHFEKAAESADQCEIRERAKDLEPAFFNCILIFGDFSASKPYYANLNNH